MGANEFGHLGNGNTESKNTPQLILKDTEINNIACGAEYFIFSKSNCSLYLFIFNVLF